jgi:hypothetical protein
MIVIQGEELGECRVAGVTMQSSLRNTAVVYPDAILRVVLRDRPVDICTYPDAILWVFLRGSTVDAIPRGPVNSAAILQVHACYKSKSPKTIRIAAGSGRKPAELFP